MKKTILSTLTIITWLGLGSSAQAATLHVHHSSFGSWKLDCDVVTSGHQLKQLKNVTIKTVLGSASNQHVQRENARTVHVKFTRHIAALAYHEDVKIRLNKGQLYVTTS
ncbi:hypothetical protein GPK34_00190 [Secundilactobacillus kimchicus]|uniref:hypothetical protein n=1 Tax=Secundilactobacillus kimchicus TaxID=528209 RepID=UPI001C01E72D|nr:hypothetical protein [Secundilactobacillus kimchicus]MBT9670455.1 hypothetical protein [Secundilactobacillus kimchicus]